MLRKLLSIGMTPDLIKVNYYGLKLWSSFFYHGFKYRMILTYIGQYRGWCCPYGWYCQYWWPILTYIDAKIVIFNKIMYFGSWTFCFADLHLW